MRKEGLVRAAVVLLAVAGLTVGCKPMEKMGWVRMRKHNELRDSLSNAHAQVGAQKAELAVLGDENAQLRRRADDASKQLLAMNQDKTTLQRQLDQSRTQTAKIDTQLVALRNDLKSLASARSTMFEWNAANNSLVVRAHFELGSAEINPDDKKSLASAAERLKKIPSGYIICIDGHTDDLPVKNPETKKNHGDLWGLGAHRALAVLRVLESHGVDPNRMIARSFADRDPLAQGTSPTARRKNRRVEISFAPSAPAAHLAVLEH